MNAYDRVLADTRDRWGDPPRRRPHRPLEDRPVLFTVATVAVALFAVWCIVTGGHPVQHDRDQRCAAGITWKCDQRIDLVEMVTGR